MADEKTLTGLEFIRYGLALLVLASHLPSLGLWLVIHPFSAFWRKLGGGWTVFILALPVAAWIAGVWLLREPLLGTNGGTHAVAIMLSGLSLAGAVGLRIARIKSLDSKRITGFPELSRENYPGTLLTDGIYGRIRNPRYMEMLLMVLGYSLFANYSGPFLAWLISLPVLFFVVVLEERELRERFGTAYDEYCRRVPRFIPRLRTRKE
ncbi:MAG: isoprenylcysteine carboxylmethyltransferase family protein [Anaerolineales bacterium]